MLLNFLYIFTVIHSITCAFPKYIEKCPKADPNANNCVLEKAKKAFALLQHGDADLNLPSYQPYKFNNVKLSIGNSADIVISGQGSPSNDVQVTQARIDLQQKYWYIVLSANSDTFNFNFTLNIKGNKGLTAKGSKGLTAKGQATIILSNWLVEYTGYYQTVTINNEKYMQISHSDSKFDSEKYNQKISDLTTIDNKKLSDSEQKKVQDTLKNLETTIKQYIIHISNTGITLELNTILKLEPESDIFLN